MIYDINYSRIMMLRQRPSSGAPELHVGFQCWLEHWPHLPAHCPYSAHEVRILADLEVILRSGADSIPVSRPKKIP